MNGDLRVDTTSATAAKPAVPGGVRAGAVANPVAAASQKGQDAAAIAEGSEFARAIRTLFARLRPAKLVETGTYLGTGSTLILCEALRDAGLSQDGRALVSIEVNPEFQAKARKNLAERGFFPRLLSGLSVPRRLLPTEADIQRETLDAPPDASIFIDHQPEKRVFYYRKETDFPEAAEDLLGQVLREFGGAPDFVMLDSRAGHMGFVEFEYVLGLIQKPCVLALDDVYHVKHFRSLQMMQQDGRFGIVELSREKFGFCIAEFRP